MNRNYFEFPLSYYYLYYVFRYESRWKLVAGDYSKLRTRLLFSNVLDNTRLSLPQVNEVTVKNWFQNTQRRNEIKILLQGVNLPTLSLTANGQLPGANQLLSSHPEPADTLVFHDQLDLRGTAVLRAATSGQPVRELVNYPHGTSVTENSAAVMISRTTAWRQKKRTLEQSTENIATSSVQVQRQQNTERKMYTCKQCNLPMISPGHSQFRGRRFCPKVPGALPLNQWLQQCRDEAARKKQHRAVP